jgi:hypothetical protein
VFIFKKFYEFRYTNGFILTKLSTKNCKINLLVLVNKTKKRFANRFESCSGSHFQLGSASFFVLAVCKAVCFFNSVSFVGTEFFNLHLQLSNKKQLIVGE